MPRPQNPPTPASSTEIKSKDGSQYPPLQMSFELPPPAVVAGPNSTSTPSRKTSVASSSYPTSESATSPATAGELVKTRRRSSIAPAPNKDAFALPPPPTRSRKIIQMKPKGQGEESSEVLEESSKTQTKSTAAGAKKKQPSSTSVAGRKIARKTAHSLIERRRRSKMNEEFGVLKDMIPACTGDMHKLAILQASIDYIRYLEDCVSKLKSSSSNAHSQVPQHSEQFMLPPPASLAAYTPRQHAPPTQTNSEEDVDMEDSSNSRATSPTTTTTPHLHSQPHSRHPSISPAILPQDRHSSYSSASTDQRHYSFSAGTSPALGPQLGTVRNGFGSALTSPALMPQRGSIGERDFDHEATAALLMLNTDRRGVSGVVSGRGMSVKDMLSS